MREKQPFQRISGKLAPPNEPIDVRNVTLRLRIRKKIPMTPLIRAKRLILELLGKGEKISAIRLANLCGVRKDVALSWIEETFQQTKVWIGDYPRKEKK